MEKKQYLLKYLPESQIVNIEDLECPSLSYLREYYDTQCCVNHVIKKAVCALQNVLNLQNWYNEYCTAQELSRDIASDEEALCSCFCI